MMNTTNTYFDNLYRIGCEYEAARAERQARKKQIIDTLGWDSEELKAWYEEDAAAKFPFSQGISKAFRAWKSSLSRSEDEIEMDDFLWEGEVHDFVEALREAGLTERHARALLRLSDEAAAGGAILGPWLGHRHEGHGG